MAIAIHDNIVRSTDTLSVPDGPYPDYIMGRIRAHGNRIAIVDPTAKLNYTYKELARATLKMAAAFQHHGLRPGDMVCVHSFNSIHTWTVSLAVSLAGAVLVFVKVSLTSGELMHQMLDVKPKFVICDVTNCDKVNQAVQGVPSVQKLFCNEESSGFVCLTSLLDTDEAEFEKPADINPKEAAHDIMFSSGTTGRPKGVVLTHYNMMTMVQQTGPYGVGLFERDDVLLGWNPISHVSGFNYGHYMFNVGGTVVVMNGLSEKNFFQHVQEHKITVLLLLPTFMRKLVTYKEAVSYDTSSVRTIMFGGSTCPQDTIDGIQRIFRNLTSLRQLYGMTETNSLSNAAPRNGIFYQNTGPPFALMEMRIADLGSGETLGCREKGEVRFRGPNITTGYFNRPDATDEALDTDGWFRTGDVGYFDEEGNLYIVDRLKEIIKCLDTQVSPAEIEDVLVRCEAVKEVVVVGLPHPDYGEAPAAFVVLKQDYDQSETTHKLEELTANNLSRAKQLYGGVHFVTSLPKLESGKYLRRQVRDEHLKQLNHSNP